MDRVCIKVFFLRHSVTQCIALAPELSEQALGLLAVNNRPSTSGVASSSDDGAAAAARVQLFLIPHDLYRLKEREGRKKSCQLASSHSTAAAVV